MLGEPLRSSSFPFEPPPPPLPAPLRRVKPAVEAMVRGESVVVELVEVVVWS